MTNWVRIFFYKFSSFDLCIYFFSSRKRKRWVKLFWMLFWENPDDKSLKTFCLPIWVDEKQLLVWRKFEVKLITSQTNVQSMLKKVIAFWLSISESFASTKQKLTAHLSSVIMHNLSVLCISTSVDYLMELFIQGKSFCCKTSTWNLTRINYSPFVADISYWWLSSFM